MRYPSFTLVATSLVLAGCSSRFEDHGNITQVTLSAMEQQAVASMASKTLFASFAAKTVFDFPHSQGNSFAQVLASNLRARGFGVNEQSVGQGNMALRYQLVSLGPQHFYLSVVAGPHQFTQGWSIQGNQLAPWHAKAYTQGEIR